MGEDLVFRVRVGFYSRVSFGETTICYVTLA
jgi:hypothetical protein